MQETIIITSYLCGDVSETIQCAYMQYSYMTYVMIMNEKSNEFLPPVHFLNCLGNLRHHTHFWNGYICIVILANMSFSKGILNNWHCGWLFI